MNKHCFSFTKPAAFPDEEGGLSTPFRWIVISLLFLFGLAGCQSSSSQASTPTTAKEEVVLDPTSTQTHPPPPSETPLPTETPISTATATSTETPQPTQSPTSTPMVLPEGVELINLRTSDGIDLAGYLHSSDLTPQRDLAVVLSHGAIGSHEEWEKFTPLFVENGFTTMTFDHRGHGASSGFDSHATIGIDVEAVVDFLRKEGFERVVCIGSSRGAVACLAATLLTDIDGLVMMSGASGGPLNIPKFDHEIDELKIPKIFMIAEEDWLGGPEFIETFLKMAERAEEPKSIYVFPGIQHGLGLLIDEAVGEQVQEILLDFLNGLSQ